MQYVSVFETILIPHLIFKALQLLEYLVKNGSERVVDDARSHSSIIKILRNFHYIDEKGKDQGLNVRNRASEIADLLGDVDKIRAERKKSRALRSKFVGFESQSSSLYSHHSMSAGSSRHYGRHDVLLFMIIAFISIY